MAVIVAPCSALGAETVTRPLTDLEMVYRTPLVEAPIGSIGIATRYFSFVVKTLRSIKPVQVPPNLQISVELEVIVAGIVPVLSIAY